MEFKREKPDCKFSLPDKLTVRQQLAYFSAAGAAEKHEILLRSWEGAKSIIIPASWKCAIFSDIETDLDKVTDPQVTEVILWAGMEVRAYMNKLEEMPKN